MQVASGDLDALDARLAEMEQRWATLVQSQAEPQPTMVIDESIAKDDEVWPLMPAEHWRACPIGSLPDGRPVQLDLV